MVGQDVYYPGSVPDQHSPKGSSPEPSSFSDPSAVNWITRASPSPAFSTQSMPSPGQRVLHTSQSGSYNQAGEYTSSVSAPHKATSDHGAIYLGTTAPFHWPRTDQASSQPHTIRYHPVGETVFNPIPSLADVLEYLPLLVGAIKPDQSGNLNVYLDKIGAGFVYELRNEMYPGDHVQGLDPRGLDISLPAPGDPLIAVKFTAVGKPRSLPSYDPTDRAHRNRLFHSPITLLRRSPMADYSDDQGMNSGHLEAGPSSFIHPLNLTDRQSGHTTHSANNASGLTYATNGSAPVPDENQESPTEPIRGMPIPVMPSKGLWLSGEYDDEDDEDEEDEDTEYMVVDADLSMVSQFGGQIQPPPLSPEEPPQKAIHNEPVPVKAQGGRKGFVGGFVSDLGAYRGCCETEARPSSDNPATTPSWSYRVLERIHPVTIRSERSLPPSRTICLSHNTPYPSRPVTKSLPCIIHITHTRSSSKAQVHAIPKILTLRMIRSITAIRRRPTKTRTSIRRTNNLL